MNDVGGLGRIPSGIERVNRSHASRDEPRRQQKEKDRKKEQDPKSEDLPDTQIRSDEESTEKESGGVIDVLDESGEVHKGAASKEDSDDADSEERGRHLDTRV